MVRDMGRYTPAGDRNPLTGNLREPEVMNFWRERPKQFPLIQLRVFIQGTGR
jgi:hypothetical protein